jgi:hypothetical protein
MEPSLVEPGLVEPDDNDNDKITPQTLDKPRNPAYDNNNNSSNASGPSRTTTTPRAME